MLGPVAVVLELVVVVLWLVVVAVVLAGAVAEPGVVVLVGAPVVVGAAVVVEEEPPVAAGRFGYAGLLQHALESACGPVCGAWSDVMAISPPAL